MLDMRWKLLLTPACRDVPDSMVSKNTLRGSDFSHNFVRVIEKLSVHRERDGQAASYSLVAPLESGKMEKKKNSLLTKWKNLDPLTCKLNLQHEPWLSGCLLHRKYGNTLKLIVFINNIGPESIIVINLVSKAITIMLGRVADFEAGGKGE